MSRAKIASLCLIGLGLVVLIGLGVRRWLEARGAPESLPWPAALANGTSALAPHTTWSVATFSAHNAPDNCADVTFFAGKNVDPKKLADKGLVLLKKPCAKAFADRAAFAWCTRFDQDGRGQPAVDGVGYYYDVASLDADDTFHHQCVRSGGSWTTAPADDPAYVRARARNGGAKAPHRADCLRELML